MHSWSASANAARVLELAASANSCQETVDLPTPAGPVIHKRDPAASHRRAAGALAVTITTGMAMILGSGTTRGQAETTCGTPGSAVRRSSAGDRTALILAYAHSAAAKVEPAVTRAIKKAAGEAEGHHVQARKGAIADAQQKMAESAA